MPVEMMTPARANAVEIAASAEIPPSTGELDDVAIWVAASDPAMTRILTTDKEQGLFVHDLEGNQIQSFPGFLLNNVDLRYAFPLGGASYAIAIATDREDDTLAIFLIEETTGEVSLAPGSGYVVGGGSPFPVYGSCLYRTPDGTFYAFVNTKGGAYKQFLMEDDGAGSVGLTEVRTFGVESQPEGCVVDDDHGVAYLGEELFGVHRIDADPASNDVPVPVDSVENNRLTPDVEGLAIYRTADGGGYVLVSSQGDDTIAVYERLGDNRYIGSFHVIAGQFDEVTHTDGLEVTPGPLLPAYPNGLLVIQDDADDSNGRSAFKLVRWDDIANGFDPPLVVDTAGPVRPAQ